ncbi:MAG: DnaK suppressor protein [Arenicella sp.]|jgi:DnaK suppressor protein
MNSELLEQIKSKLVNEQQRLSGLLERTHAHTHRTERLNAGFAEQAIETENDQVVDALDREGKIELIQINKALKRIDDSVYGKCDSCHTNIPEARLLAIPETELCITCASKVQDNVNQTS